MKYTKLNKKELIEVMQLIQCISSTQSLQRQKGYTVNTFFLTKKENNYEIVNAKDKNTIIEILNDGFIIFY